METPLEPTRTNVRKEVKSCLTFMSDRGSLDQIPSDWGMGREYLATIEVLELAEVTEKSIPSDVQIGIYTASEGEILTRLARAISAVYTELKKRKQQEDAAAWSSHRLFQEITSLSEAALSEMKDTDNRDMARVHFNLEEIKEWEFQRPDHAYAAKPGATRWELNEIYQRPGVWDSVVFYRNGQVVARPATWGP